jgi:hypothetical protein
MFLRQSRHSAWHSDVGMLQNHDAHSSHHALDITRRELLPPWRTLPVGGRDPSRGFEEADRCTQD